MQWSIIVSDQYFRCFYQKEWKFTLFKSFSTSLCWYFACYFFENYQRKTTNVRKFVGNIFTTDLMSTARKTCANEPKHRSTAPPFTHRRARWNICLLWLVGPSAAPCRVAIDLNLLFWCFINVPVFPSWLLLILVLVIFQMTKSGDISIFKTENILKSASLVK